MKVEETRLLLKQGKLLEAGAIGLYTRGERQAATLSYKHADKSLSTQPALLPHTLHDELGACLTKWHGKEVLFFLQLSFQKATAGYHPKCNLPTVHSSHLVSGSQPRIKTASPLHPCKQYGSPVHF